MFLKKKENRNLSRSSVLSYIITIIITTYNYLLLRIYVQRKGKDRERN